MYMCVCITVTVIVCMCLCVQARPLAVAGSACSPLCRPVTLLIDAFVVVVAAAALSHL